MIRLHLFDFRISRKTSGTQIVVCHSELTVLHCSRGIFATEAVLSKKQASICVEVFAPRTSFIRFGSSSKTHTVDCCFVSGSYVYIHYSSPVTILYTFLKHCDRILRTFLYTNRHEPFFERMSNCAVSNEKKSFLRPGVSAILNVFWWKKRPSISQYVTWRSCIISSRSTSMFSGTTTVFGGPSRNSSLS